MTAFKFDARFSMRPEVLKVEQKFGPAGMARMVKLLELMTLSSQREQGVIEMAMSDWQECLQMGQTLLIPFLVYLQQAEWLTVDQPAEQGAPLRVTIMNPDQYFLESTEPAAPVLLENPSQWREWFTVEYCATDDVLGAAETMLLFRRWCATNVTTIEMNAAVELAIKARQAPLPGVLHEHLKTVRLLKIQEACR